MVLPESEKNVNDVLDFMVDACSEIVDVTNSETGQIEKQQVLNTKKVYYKTQLVNSPNFSRFVLELENFEAMANDCEFNMSKPRALVMARQIKAYVNSFRLSIDAKSSESLRDKYNTQGTLVHELLKNKVEKAFTLKGELGKSFWSGLTGREGQEQAQG